MAERMAGNALDGREERIVERARGLRGTPSIPGDKSVSHRGFLFGALAEGRTELLAPLESADVLSTAACLRALGVRMERRGDRFLIEGCGGRFPENDATLDCGNSGTTMRLLMGILAARPGLRATLVGDASLSARPMARVARPLREMGGRVALAREDYAPVRIEGAALAAIDYAMPVASAQIKSAILLAGLAAEGTTRIRFDARSRDHSERLLGLFGAKVDSEPGAVSIAGGQTLRAARVRVPGDPSTAAFWAGAACVVPNSRIEMGGISLNPTRLGFFRALARMGANVEMELAEDGPEPIGRIVAETSRLSGVTIGGAEVPSLIDEIPLLAILATQAEGETVIEGAAELRVKESDRIEAVAKNLRAMGARIEVRPDGFRIEGGQKLRGAAIDPERDHRIAMGFAVAGLVAEGATRIRDAECVGVSYPAFFSTLRELAR